MAGLLEASKSPTTLLELKQWRRGVKHAVRNIILAPEINFRLYLKKKYGYKGGKPADYPSASWHNAVLHTQKEVQEVIGQVQQLGLPHASDPPKNWDALAALDCILKSTDPNAHILDAGAELYSMVLPWLYLYGYRNLTGINLVFRHPVRRGPIHYVYGDITQTSFKPHTFDAITCLSVIEHGVDVRLFFQEAARLLKPNGLLIVSTDYYSEPVDTRGLKAYGVPVHIFSKNEMLKVLHIAQECGLELTGPINLDCQERPVSWKEFHLDYTFVTFTLRKIGQ